LREEEAYFCKQQTDTDKIGIE